MSTPNSQLPTPKPSQSRARGESRINKLDGRLSFRWSSGSAWELEVGSWELWRADLLGVPAGRQQELERRAAVRRVGGADRAAVPLDDRANDRQAEPAARGARGRGPGLIHLVEAIEDVGQVLRRDAGPVVAHSDV